MAAYAVTAAQKAAHEKTLVANTEDTVTFARDCEAVEVLNHNTAFPIYFTVDGTAATVGGAQCYVVPAGLTALEVGVPGVAGNTVVRLISSGAAKYSCTGSMS